MKWPFPLHGTEQYLVFSNQRSFCYFIQMKYIKTGTDPQVYTGRSLHQITIIPITQWSHYSSRKSYEQPPLCSSCFYNGQSCFPSPSGQPTFPMPHLLACLPTHAVPIGGTGPIRDAAPVGTTATGVNAAGAVGRVAGTVLFSLFPLLPILRGSPGKCHKAIRWQTHRFHWARKEQKWTRKLMKLKLSIILTVSEHLDLLTKRVREGWKLPKKKR